MTILSNVMGEELIFQTKTEKYFLGFHDGFYIAKEVKGSTYYFGFSAWHSSMNCGGGVYYKSKTDIMCAFERYVIENNLVSDVPYSSSVESTIIDALEVDIPNDKVLLEFDKVRYADLFRQWWHTTGCAQFVDYVAVSESGE